LEKKEKKGRSSPSSIEKQAKTNSGEEGGISALPARYRGKGGGSHSSDCRKKAEEDAREGRKRSPEKREEKLFHLGR